MDKKNTVIGLFLLMAAFTLMVFQRPTAPYEAEEEAAPPELVPEVTPRPAEPRAPALAVTPAEPLPQAEVEEEIVRLENEYVIVEFTNLGGAIRQVILKEHARAKGSEDRYVINDVDPIPALALLNLPGAGPEAGYRVLGHTATEVSYGIALSETVDVVRTYRLEQEAGQRDPGAYLVQHATEFRNSGEQDLLLREFGVHLGTAVPTGRQTLGMEHLNFNYFDGAFHHLAPRKFAGGGFLSWIGVKSGAATPFIEERRPFEWAAVKNQFFASILTPETTPVGFVARPVELPMAEGDKRPPKGMTGQILFDLRQIPAQGTESLAASFYAGPKEYRRLEAMGQQQDRVMQFGWPFFAFISKLLLSMMVGIHGNVVANYGLAIILVTVIIKTILWPLTAIAARSSKRMAKIQEPMKALREKYKDDPRRMQAETMKLFREAKVNPLGGCLPMLVQIPIFLALFRMIMSAAELRFAEFLWVGDLSAPDTIAHVMGLPINILPVFMAITMFYQMRMMPMAMDSTQQKIFRLMPLIMFFFSYTFSAGLVLYWTVQNLLTILQQFLTNRRGDPVVDTAGTASGTAKGAEPVHVSPYLKKKKGKKKKQE